MKINHKQWHARITCFPDVQFGDTDLSKAPEDFCSYVRWFLWKLFVVIPLVCILLGGFLGQLFADIAALLTTSTLMTDMPVLMFFVFVTAIIATLVAVAFIDAWNREKRLKALKEGTYVEKEPGFISTWYGKYKNKYCPTIEVE